MRQCLLWCTYNTCRLGLNSFFQNNEIGGKLRAPRRPLLALGRVGPCSPSSLACRLHSSACFSWSVHGFTLKLTWTGGGHYTTIDSYCLQPMWTAPETKYHSPTGDFNGCWQCVITTGKHWHVDKYFRSFTFAPESASPIIRIRRSSGSGLINGPGMKPRTVRKTAKMLPA